MSIFDIDNRNSAAPNQSRKNFMNKLTNFIRKSDNNDQNGLDNCDVVGSAIVDFIMNPSMQKNGKKIGRIR